MMQQYHTIKAGSPSGSILMFRMGDFYEMFYDDAVEASRILDLTLTARGGTPMCGVPYHAAEGYLSRLVRAGKRVALCDQMEPPRPGHVVRREITQIITPGSVIETNQLPAKAHNYLGAILPSRGRFGMACLDLSTGDFRAGEFAKAEEMLDALLQFNPAEVVVPVEYLEMFRGSGVGRVREDDPETLRVSGTRNVSARSVRKSGTAETSHVPGQPDTVEAGTSNVPAVEDEPSPTAPAKTPRSSRNGPRGGAAPSNATQNSLRTLAAIGAALPALTVAFEDDAFTREIARHNLCEHFGVQSLDGFGLHDAPLAIGAAGGLFLYLTQSLRRNLAHVRRITQLIAPGRLMLDAATRRNLELVESIRATQGSRTLLEAVDRTCTMGGGRTLRNWLLEPLCEIEPLRARQDAVAWFLNHEENRERLREHLKGVRDLERLIGRLAQGAGNARDLTGLRLSLSQLPELLSHLETPPPSVAQDLAAAPLPFLLQQLKAQVSPLPELVELLARAIEDEPPLPLKEGGIIRSGYHLGLDELRAAATEGKDWVAQLQQREQVRTGIKSLKVRYNQVFGYYIEISTANLASVPADYTRKQTMANAERYITPELKEMEGKILGAEERSRQLEYELFIALRAEAVSHIAAIQATAAALNALDVLAGWGTLAQERDYRRPDLTTDSVLNIEDGRHPVIEQMLPSGGVFVPNDTLLNNREQNLVVLTGPNMAGKSTYIRQVALIAILAHCGCFVPARRATVGLLDRVFTRVGANDDLSRGQSTFMVEMNETANILHHATKQSLVILDEIGRGTSTFDGLSIAWAVAEHLCSQIGAKTLFATHYHELTELPLRCPGVKNYNVAVREWGDQIVFLHKILPGGADKSYGIQVARLAGLPQPVLVRARQLLRQLEEGELDEHGQPRLGKTRGTKAAGGKRQGAEARTRKLLEEEFDLFQVARIPRKRMTINGKSVVREDEPGETDEGLLREGAGASTDGGVMEELL